MTQVDWKKEVSEILEEKGSTTQQSVREELAKKHGADVVKKAQKHIKKAFSAAIKNKKGGEAPKAKKDETPKKEGETPKKEGETQSPPKKDKRKKPSSGKGGSGKGEGTDSDGVKKPRNQISFKVTSRSGDLAPPDLKTSQAHILKGSEFLQEAPPLEVNIFGNQVLGNPRAFKTGNFGWYSGGKIQVQVGSQTLWATLSLNVTIPGSREWEGATKPKSD